MPDFQIVTRGLPALAEEWLWATRAPDSELPSLTEEDRQRARTRHITDEQYAPHLLLRACARERESKEGERLGRIVIELLKGIDGEFQLSGIVKRGLEPGWHALIKSHSSAGDWKFLDVSLPTEDFPWEPGRTVLDASNPDEIREYLLAKLGREKPRTVAS